jgi:large subunit ribosomal protein L7Ae
MSYVDLQIPDDIKKRILDFLKTMMTTIRRNDKDVPVIKKEWKIKRGLIETAKALERNQLKFLIIAADIGKPNPKKKAPVNTEMIQQCANALPKVAQEKKIPYAFLDSKADLGKVCGMKIECSAIGIMELPKEADTEMKNIIALLGSKK